MAVRNYEFKAKVDELEAYENLLKQKHPDYVGEDHQVDTYFDTGKGRLKLREGTIENALIEYYRADVNATKSSAITLFKHRPDESLKKILTHQFGVKTIVDKRRRIYFVDHTKFHFDRVEGLGTFIEVEVIDETDQKPIADLKALCDDYFEFFGLEREQLQAKSYSDMVTP